MKNTPTKRIDTVGRVTTAGRRRAIITDVARVEKLAWAMHDYMDVGGRVTHGAVTEEVEQSFRSCSRPSPASLQATPEQLPSPQGVTRRCHRLLGYGAKAPNPTYRENAVSRHLRDSTVTQHEIELSGYALRATPTNS